MTFSFDNSYARLPARFYARVLPEPATRPRLVAWNQDLSKLLGADPTLGGSPSAAETFGGNVVPVGAEPIALAYSGHQFGTFVPQLGDGRALLLGEVIGTDGKRRDMALKGSGRTPFSRRGDGRAALGPVLREYLVSEAMAALGIPTTRALAVVTTGDLVQRETRLPGAVLTRVAASHIRVGTFEYFAARRDTEGVALLASHALFRHFPDSSGTGSDALALLACVVEAQANLVARWLGVGFIHGVMNTDNTSISGETLDYGPCAFLDEYDPNKRFSSIDEGGRYAYARQPGILRWNLARLAECLLPLIDTDEEQAVRRATDQLERFSSIFGDAHLRILRAKLGLTREESDDVDLASDLHERLTRSQVDHTLFHRALCGAAEVGPAADGDVASLFDRPEAFHEWAARWRQRLAREETTPADRARAMRRVNPAFIPRNHRIEEMIEAAVRHADLQPFETLLRVLSSPYEEQPTHAHLAAPPEPHERVAHTFCGT
jgi:uncharacterized protein YdiU (UPF0061 family)